MINSCLSFCPPPLSGRRRAGRFRSWCNRFKHGWTRVYTDWRNPRVTVSRALSNRLKMFLRGCYCCCFFVFVGFFFVFFFFFCIIKNNLFLWEKRHLYIWESFPFRALRTLLINFCGFFFFWECLQSLLGAVVGFGVFFFFLPLYFGFIFAFLVCVGLVCVSVCVCVCVCELLLFLAF